MSYCIKCGVELSDYSTKCPLCETEVVFINEIKPKVNTDYPVYRTESVDETKRVNSIFVGRLLSMIFFNYAAIILIINLSVNKAITWSVIPILSIALIWFGVAYPFYRKKNTFFRLYTFDSLAVIVYLLLLNIVIAGNVAWAKYASLSVALVWAILAGFFVTEKIKRRMPISVFYILSAVLFFVAFAFAIDNRISVFKLVLPITGLVLIVSLIAYFVITANGNDFLGIMWVALFSAAVICLGIEMIISGYIHGHISLSWSLIVSAVTIPMFVSTLTIKKSRELKSIISKRLHR